MPRLRRTLYALAPLLLAACAALTEPTDGGAGARSLTTPTAVFGTQQWTAVSAGELHTCGIDATGAAWCWGSNQYGQLGVETVNRCSTVGTCVRRPLAVQGGHQFVRIAAGRSHSCGLTAAGAAWCWGGGNEADNAGFLGNGIIVRSTMPVRVTADSAFTEIAVGHGNSCALTASGQAWCWGRNLNGELGDGTQFPRTVPIAIAGTTRFVRISMGASHGCGISVNGGTFCWGSNRFGQLGIGEVPFNTVGLVEATPTRVQDATSLVEIAAGGNHTCALEADGEILCWGLNANAGQLGDESGLTHRGVPGPVFGARSYGVVASGLDTSCGVTTEGSPFCWGSNFFGTIGNGSRDALLYETPVPNLGSAFTALAGGGAHMCGLTADQRIFCWGDEKYGQTGS